MIQDQATHSLSEDRRKEIFLALVNAQDYDMDVAESRQFIVEHFGISEGQVRQVEREGIQGQWPPL